MNVNLRHYFFTVQSVKKSMIEKNKIKLDTLRSVKSAFLLEMSKDGSKELSDEVSQKIILKLFQYQDLPLSQQQFQ